MISRTTLIRRTLYSKNFFSGCLSSSNSSGGFGKRDATLYPVYTHFLSKSILEHLQNEKSDWVRSHGLQYGLNLNSNGTFVLRFPPSNGQRETGHIWTSYDSSKKQHWISLYKNGSMYRHLIKDNINSENMPASAVSDRIKTCVEEVIKTVDSAGEI
mmetsp:Transcript_16741/g.25297  ORF Transcript_16741/g.25297 Transcript_16741/m.25297 type:complete len:157 (-) Transcript_16741:253-723(-)